MAGPDDHMKPSDAGKGCDPSASPGQGARVQLHLPLASLAPAAAPLETPPLKAPQEGIRLVVVDDHALVRQTLIAALAAQARLRVVGEASNGLEALACVERELPTVVLMDLNMPVMNGIEATRGIKQRWPAVRVIGLSLHDDPSVIASVLSAGADRYVIKSSNLAILVRAIRECADEALAPDLAADSITPS